MESKAHEQGRVKSMAEKSGGRARAPLRAFPARRLSPVAGGPQGEKTGPSNPEPSFDDVGNACQSPGL